MTNYYENLDIQLNQLRFVFLKSYTSHDFITAAIFLFTRNEAHPEDARLDDMKPFRLHSNSSRAKNNANLLAKLYCDKWMPKLERGMSLFRKENIDAYNQL
jgi:hypothetical protein